jgi:hypothetical protein
MNSYIAQILWLLTWPVIIFISYLFVKLALKKYEKAIRIKNSDKDEKDR